ncbi:MAG: ABC transporter substrate-binding protein [Chloroflexota bacterium]
MGIMSLAACGGNGTVSASQSPASAATSPRSASAASSNPAVKPAGSASGEAPAGAATSISLAYAQASASQAVVFVTQDAGFFAKHGLNVALKEIGGPQQIPALLSGELEVAGVGGLEAVNAAVGGAPVVMVATATDLPPVSLYVDKQITSPEQLKGKAIGITAAGSATDATAQLFLKHFGLAGQVGIQPSGGTQTSLFAAMQQGLVAGGML